MSGTAMRTAVNAKGSASEAGSDVLRRSCTCGTCNSCAAKKSRGLRDGLAPPAVHDVLHAPGRPLDSGMRGFMEQRFGQDFSGVRVHADGDAASSAAAVQARAYTVGEHIVLGDRARRDDKRLHAHELAHVVQQRASGTQGMGRLAELEVGSASDPAEAEADRMAGEALRGSAVSKPARHPPALRRDGAPPGNAAPKESQPASATKPAEKPAEQPAAPTKSETETALDVDLGRHSKTGHGRADAVLHRGPAMVKAGQEAQPCELELQMKVHFDFHLGTPRSKPLGGPWPADRAKAWKKQYMSAAQSTWNTDIAVFSKTVLERQGDCPGEPCTQAVGHLRVIDVDTMTDADDKKVDAAGGTSPHFNVNVYEQHPMISEKDRNEQIAKGETPDDISYVGDDYNSRLFDDSTQSRTASKPPGFDDKAYRWNPGGASHETGHMLGLPHDQCGPDTDNPNDEKCYSSGGIMGKGTNVSTGDLKPFLVGMNATTGCEWKATSTTRVGRVVAAILGSVLGAGLIAGGIALGTYLGNKK